ncbi:MAG: hypothetical protein EBQ96_08205 [Proteobacteria bacterium]|nr:hypothetical protein [Pseudomonadota bacterium]
MHGTFGSLSNGSGNCGQRLRDFIAYSDALLKSLSDPVYGPIGQEAFDRFVSTGCGEHTAAGDPYFFACYTPFKGPGTPSVVNTIFYHTHNFGVPRRYEGMAISRHHEIVHACAWNHCAALHASPYNGATQIVMSPWDWLRMAERTEQDAIAKQGWLSSLAAKNHPGFRDFSQWDPVSADIFDEVRARSLNLEETLNAVAAQAMEREGSFRYQTNEPTNFRGYYRSYALWQYEHMLAFLEKSGIRPTFVKLEPHHHTAMGRSFGPILRVVPLSDLSAKDAVHLIRICEKFRIPLEKDLPHFEDALAACGLTPESFLALSRGGPRKATISDAPPVAKSLAIA